MEPVAWQYKSASGEWKIGSDYSREHMERNGYETRDLYAIPEECVVVPVEITEEIAEKMLEHMSYREADWVWQDIIGLVQEDSQ